MRTTAAATTDPSGPAGSGAVPDRAGGATARLLRLARSPLAWLVVVAVAFAVVQLVIVPLRTYLSWDEAVYASRFSTIVPQVQPGPHRAIGMPLLLAPVTAFTASVVALRAYLVVLSAVALHLAFRPWLAFGGWPAPLAAALFAGAGLTLENAAQGLPNVLAALATVGAAGWFVRLVTAAARRPRAGAGPASDPAAGPAFGPAAVGLGVALAVLALVRPTDAVWAALPLAVLLLAVPSWRRPRVLVRCVVPAAAGLAVGAIAWLVEAIVRFGGPVRRLADMRGTTEAGDGGLATALAALHPTLPVVTVVLAVVAGVVLIGTRRRVRHAAAWLVAIGVAVGVELPYLVLIDYASDRYLLTPGALLALPVAAAVCWAVRRVARLLPARPARVVLAGVLVVLGLVAEAGQVGPARATWIGTLDHRAPKLAYAGQLRDLGVVAPCLVSGDYAPQLGYVMGCESGDIVSATPTDASRAEVSRRDRARARAEGARYVEVVLTGRRPPHLAGWRRVVLHDPADTAYAYFPPGS